MRSGSTPPTGSATRSAAGSILELAAAHPERIRRAVLLDPAIQILPHIAEAIAELERAEPVYDSPEDYADRREDSPPRELVLHDAALHCERAPGRSPAPAHATSRRSSRSTASSRSPPPPPETLRAPTLLVHAPSYGLVREEQLAAYADRVETLAVPGMHMVMWDAFDEVADAVERFL